MATIKLGTTGSASRLISYAEKRAVEKEGIECNPEYAKTQFKATRELQGKADGIQAHHVIQSFAPGEVTPRLANEIGQDLAKKLAKGHECVVYTHTDKGHIHNHIVINNVNYENGKKFQLHGQKAIDKVRAMSDDLCKERGLSVVKEKTAKVRYTMAEKSVIEKGGVSWKDELRQAIDHEKAHSNSYKEFKQNLTEKYGIEVNDKGKHITYKHPDHAKVVRGNKLGLDYERSTIEHGFSRQIERANTRISTPSITSKAEGLERIIKGGVGELTLKGATGGISSVITAIEKGARQLAPKLREDEPSLRGKGESAPKLEPNVEPKREEPVREVKRPRVERGWDLER